MWSMGPAGSWGHLYMSGFARLGVSHAVGSLEQGRVLLPCVLEKTTGSI